LTIRAELLPDDATWNPQRMPIITSVIAPAPTSGDGEEARGLEIEASHVTIEGLRFTGSPLYYYIDGKQSRRYYPIWREGKNLDDLVVTQCLFAGNGGCAADSRGRHCQRSGLSAGPLRILQLSKSGGVLECTRRNQPSQCHALLFGV